MQPADAEGIWRADSLADHSMSAFMNRTTGDANDFLKTTVDGRKTLFLRNIFSPYVEYTFLHNITAI